jgi:hypothetical protein
MANLYGLDAGGNAAYVKSTGAGSNTDPFIVQNDAFCTEVKSAFVTATGTINIVPLVASTKLRVMAMTITAVSGCTVKIQSSGATLTDKTPPFHIGANGNLTQANAIGLFDSNTGEGLTMVASGITTYAAMLTYREVV